MPSPQPVWQVIRRLTARSTTRAGALLIASLALMTHFYLGAAIIPPASSDGVYFYHILASLAGDGDLDFTNNYQIAALPDGRRDPYDYLARRTPTGLPTTEMTTGPALLWLPFAAAGRLVSLLTEPTPDGLPALYRYGVMTTVGWSGVVFAHLAALLLADIFRRYLPMTQAALCSLSLLWLTNALFYATQQPLFSHAADLLMMSLVLWLGWRFSLRWERRWAALAGLADGLAASVRMQNAVSLAILAGCFGFAWARLGRPSRRDAWATCGLFVAAALIGAAPQLAANVVLFGAPFVIPQGPGFLNLAEPHLWDGLVSTRNGLFVYSPFLMMGALGAAVALIQTLPGPGPLPGPPPQAGEGNKKPSAYKIAAPRLVLLVLLPMALVFAAQLWINTSARDWWGGNALGQRRLISSYSFFAAGMAAGWTALRRAKSARLRRWVGPAVGLCAAACLAINLALVDLAPTWGETAHDLARDVPRYAADVLTREFEMRPGCGEADRRRVDATGGVLFGRSMYPPGGAIRAEVTSADQMLGTAAQLDAAAGERLHFGFRLETPYGWRNSVTLMLWDADSGAPIARQIFYNEVNGPVGVTGVIPRSPMRIRAEAYFNNTRLPDPMPTVIRDVELCVVRRYRR